MKRISLARVVLGVVAGALIAILSGSWIFWLAVGLALGIVAGSASSRAITDVGKIRNGSV